MYKLIALDIDGTLLNSEKKITNEVFNSIQEAKKVGAKVVLSTGRPLPGVTPLLNELNLNDDGDYVICFNGAVVQEVKSKKVLSNIEMCHDDFVLINNLAKENGTVALFCSQPFTTKLINSNLNSFKYEWIWEKNNSTGFMNANKIPLRKHENIAIFYKKQCTYKYTN